MSQPHIIGSQQLEIELNRLESSWSIQEELSMVIQHQLQPQMEQLFDRLVPSDQVIRIDQLQLDIGEVSVKHLETELGPIILRALEEKIQDLMMGYALPEEGVEISRIAVEEAAVEILLYFLRHGYLPWWKKEHDFSVLLTEWDIQLQQQAQARKQVIDLLARDQVARNRFLKQIPQETRNRWLSTFISTSSSFHEILAVVPEVCGRLTSDKRDQTRAERTFWEVLIWEISHHFSPSRGQADAQLVQKNLFTNWLTSWVSEQKIVPMIHHATKFQPFFEKKLAGIPSSMVDAFQLALVQLLATHSHVIASETLASLKLSFPGIEPNLAQLLPELNERNNTLTESGKEDRKGGNGQNKHPFEDVQKNISIDHSPRDSNSHSQEEQSSFSPQQQEGSTNIDEHHSQTQHSELQDISFQPSFEFPSEEKQTEIPRNQAQELSSFLLEQGILSSTSPAYQDPTPSVGEFFFVKNAGIVLLHPFLPTLFDYCQWTREKQFVSLEAQQQAMLMLQFLAEGSVSTPEYELLLNKVLVSWPWEEAVAENIELKAAHQQEGEKLLQVAIDHWGSLKSASPDGLREGFLAREGKLQKTESGWKLFVEQKAQDILLTRLPWGVSMVKLPWMDEILTVEWG